MKLSKTQIQLLAECKRSPHSITAIHHGSISSRRNGSYGHRRIDAANRLSDLKLLEKTGSNSYCYHFSHGFGTDNGFETIWTITEKGKIALDSLAVTG